jgi:hypothetical protein
MPAASFIGVIAAILAFDSGFIRVIMDPKIFHRLVVCGCGLIVLVISLGGWYTIDLIEKYFGEITAIVYKIDKINRVWDQDVWIHSEARRNPSFVRSKHQGASSPVCYTTRRCHSPGYPASALASVRSSAGSSPTIYRLIRWPMRLWAFTRSLDQIRELIGGERASEVTSFEQCDLSSLQSALPEGAWITLPLDAAGLEAAWRQALLSDSRDVSFIVDRTGQLIAGADSAEDRSPARSSVLELIRAYVALRHLAAERLHVELPHQRYCTIVKRRPPQLPEKALLELGAVGSFLEQRRPSTALPALAFMEWNGESSRIESYTASLPPFYTEIIGVTVGPARGLRRFAAEKEYKRTATWP